MLKNIYNFLFFKTLFEKSYNGRDIKIFLDIDNKHGWYIKFFIEKNEKLILNKDVFYFKVYKEKSYKLKSHRIFLNYFKDNKNKINNLIENKFYDFFIEKNQKLKLFKDI